MKKGKRRSKLDEIASTRKAPVVEVDRHELGDKRLNPEEAVIRERESLLAICAKKKIGGQDELEDFNRSQGPRLQFTEIISRLRHAAPALRVLDGSLGNVALYFPRNQREYKEVVRESDGSQDGFFLYHKYVSGMPKAGIPEYASVDIDTSHLPTREGWMTNGAFVQGHSWRSVLIALMRAGVISYSAAVRQFGDVGTDKRGWRWNEQTRPWRNNPDKVFTQDRAPSFN
jgi:hypothetical protein